MTEQTQLSLNDAIKANNLDRVEELLETYDVHSNDDGALRTACLNNYLEVYPDFSLNMEQMFILRMKFSDSMSLSES